MDQADRPLYLGKCEHWIHAPTLSVTALTGRGSTIKKWDYFIANKASSPDSLALPDGLMSSVEEKWTITADVDKAMLENHHQAHQAKLNAQAPSLPKGWSPSDHSGLDAADPPADLEASLALSSYPLGSRTDSGDKPTGLKDFTRQFGTRHTGPVDMFNLVSYLPDQRHRYFEYIAAFQASVGIKYGGEPVFFGSGVSDWTSRADDEATRKDSTAAWEDSALVHYPSIWHFSKLLDDDEYIDADRTFKQGVLRDNPLMCCTEIDVSN